MMRRSRPPFVLGLFPPVLALLALAACKGEPRALAAPASASVRHPAPPAAADAAPRPEQVLQDWAAAIERRDWATVRQLWGHDGADSGQTPRAFARRWDRLRRPHVTVGAGQQEGAAGSLYYTATLTVRDGARRVVWPVTIRRVNGVDGASAAQLRWHLEPSARLPLPGGGPG